MASITIPGPSVFWMVLVVDNTGEDTIDDYEDIEFECFTTEQGALDRASERVNEYGPEEYKACVFKVEPLGFHQKIELVEFTAFRSEGKPAKSVGSAPKARRLMLTDD